MDPSSWESPLRQLGMGLGAGHSHEDRLDGVFDVAVGSPAQELPEAPLG